MPLQQYRGHLIFLSVTLLLVLFHFGMYGGGRPPRLRKVYAIVLTSCFVWALGNVGLSFELYAQPIISRIYLLLALASLALFPERTHILGAYALGKAQRLMALFFYDW